MRYILLLAALSLTGCVTPGPQARASYSPELDASTSCMTRVRSDPFILEKLQAKVGIGSPNTPPTLEMMADKSTPTAEEKAAISSYSATRERCYEMGAGYRSTVLSPGVVQATDRGMRGIQVLLAKLYAGEITYGQFNQMRVENGDRTTSEARNAIDRQNQAQAEEDQRRRQAFGMALQNMQQQQYQQQLLQQQQIQMNRPVTTDCQRFGNQVSCTSR